MNRKLFNDSSCKVQLMVSDMKHINNLKVNKWLFAITLLFPLWVNAGDTKLEFVKIVGGEFTMGDIIGKAEQESELPVHKVKVKTFYLSKNEVTRGQFSKFVNTTGYITDSEKNPKWNCGSNLPNKAAQVTWKNPGFPQTETHPVVCVSYNDVLSYTKWLKKINKKNYRLPSEAEWEYAARAGTNTEYNFGNDPNMLCKHGNVSTHPDLSCQDKYKFTSPIGSFKSNQWGLNDMHGNVTEIMSDCWNPNHVNAPINGDFRTSGNCGSKVTKSGTWGGYPLMARAAFRYRIPDHNSTIFTGFRLAYDN